MRKQLVYIIIAVLITAVLGLTLFLLMKIPPKDDDNSSISTASEIVLVSKQQSDIKNILVKNSSDTYNCEYNGFEFKIAELKGYSLDNASLTSMLSQASSISADKKVLDDASNLNEFGFDKPASQVEITYTDNTAFKFEVGNKTANGFGYYLKEKDKNTVYIVSEYTISSFLDPLISFVDKTLTESIPQEAQNTIDNIVLGGTARTEVAVRKYTEEELKDKTEFDIYTLTSPILENANSNTVSKILPSFSSITASEVISLDISPESLKHFGLDNPQYTISFTYNNTTSKLLFGRKDEDKYFVMKSGGNVIYKIFASSFDFLEFKLYKFVSPLIINANIDKVKAITVKYENKVYKFDLDGEGENLKVLSNENEINSDIFRKFYQLLISATVTDEAAKPSSSSALTITYEYKDENTKSDIIEFLPIDSRQYFISKNGTGYFYILKPYIDKVIDSVQKVINNEEITLNY